MIDFIAWYTGRDAMPGSSYDVLWVWGTIVLSGLVFLGYCVIAVSWYFQKKMARRQEARAGLRRLCIICLCSAVCGLSLYALEMPWIVWRLYDVVLLLLAAHTWRFALKSRGVGLVDECLAHMEELERSAARYREIAELLPHMVWTATADGDVDFSNQRWRQYVDDHRTWVEVIHPDEREQALAMWNRAITTREPFVSELRLGADGHYRTFVVRATPLVHGSTVKWLGACADIHEQKQLAAEKELQIRQKSFFLNALSHDIRAPLHNVVLNAHLLKLSARDSDELESINVILENAAAAGDLVTRLLDLAKIGAQDDNKIEDVSLSATLQQIMRRFLPLAEQKGLYLRINGTTDLQLRTDRQKLDRIISNLLENAIKYTSEGGATVEVVPEQGRVLIRICDTGIGIPPETVPYLFDEFYQVHNYERDRSKGFGMGLAICRSLARQIASEVRLANTGPHGSCFELLLKANGPDSRGRSLGQTSDRADPHKTGLCSV